MLDATVVPRYSTLRTRSGDISEKHSRFPIDTENTSSQPCRGALLVGARGAAYLPQPTRGPARTDEQ